MKRCLGRAERILIVAVFVLVFAHAVLIIRHFPPSSIASGSPLCSGDLSWHFASAVEGADIAEEQGHIWGYSVRFMAGYPWGVWNSFSKRSYEFASSLMPGVSLEVAYYVWLILSAFLTPMIIGLAARTAGLSLRESLLCMGGAIVVYQFGNQVTYFWTFGNTVFPLATALTLWFSAILYRAICCAASPIGGPRAILFSVAWGAGGGLVLGLCFWLHPLCMVSAAAVVAVAAWTFRRRLLRGSALPVLTAAGVALLVALPWLTVLLRFFDAKLGGGVFGLPSGWKHLVMDLFTDRAYRHPFDRRQLLHAIVILSGLGTWFAFRGNRRWIGQCGVVALILFACTYLFSYVPLLSETQPYRYLVSFIIFASVPAAFGAIRLLDLLRESNRTGITVVACVGLMFLPGLTGYMFDALQRRPAEGLQKEQTQVISWLREHGNLPGRVICEDGILGNMLPYYVDRETIGGLLSYLSPLLHSWTCVGPDRVFGSHRGKDYPGPGMLPLYLELYNVAYVIAVSPELCAELETLPGSCRKIAQFGRHVVFETLLNSRSFVVGRDGDEGGSVVTTARANVITVSNAPRGTFILKYHYIPSMFCSDGAFLSPRTMLDDPVPFVEVRNELGLSVVEVKNAY